MTNTSNEESLTQCYNKGCGQKFKLEENTEDSCCFHPGVPVFHDAYKGWSCCNKRSTDFTTFLHMEGCSKGKHNPEKPVEPVKEKCPVDPDEVITVKNPKPTPTPMERPDIDSKLLRLKTSVAQSLKDALDNRKEMISEDNDKSTETYIKIGESCKNNGCRATYEAEFSNLDICKHHAGYPVFHEGMKFWTCCMRKTSDFDSFLQQEGCSSGGHVWIKPNLKATTCRYDWHQTATHTVVTVYAKLAQPELSRVDANPVRLELRIAFGDDQQFNLDGELGGIIVPEESSVNMASTKVEIQMKKAEPQSWRNIFLPKPKVPQKEEKKESVNETALSVDAIDLSDL